MTKMKPFSIIQAFTALWEMKDKEMASFSKFVLNFIQTELNWDDIHLCKKNQQESWTLEQNIYDFEMTAISLLLISQRAVKAWIIENGFYLCYEQSIVIRYDAYFN